MDYLDSLGGLDESIFSRLTKEEDIPLLRRFSWLMAIITTLFVILFQLFFGVGRNPVMLIGLLPLGVSLFGFNRYNRLKKIQQRFAK